MRLNTAFVFEPSQSLSGPECSYDPGTGCAVAPPASCPQAIIASDAARLQRIAMLGGGDFVQFVGSTPVTLTGLVPPANAAGHACGP